MRNSLDTIEADFNNAVAPLDQSLADWVVVSGRGIKLFNDFAQRKSTSTTVGDLGDASSLGACALYKDSAAQIAMTAADAGTAPGSVSCILNKKTLDNSERAASTPGLYDRDQIARTITLISAGSTSFSYTSGTQRETQEYRKDVSGAGYDFSTLSGKTPIGSTASGTLSYAMSGGIVTSATINGDMPARVDANGAALTDRETWSIRYAVTAESGGVSKYAFSGKIDAQKNGASLGAVTVYDTSFVRATSNNDKYRMVEGLLAVGVTAGSSTVKGSLSLSQFSTDRNGNRYLPTNLKFIGSFTNTRSESFDGTITMQALNYKAVDSVAPQSASNFATGSVSFSGKLKASNLKPLTVTFALRNTGYKTTEYNGTYSDDANLISFNGDNSLPRTIYLASSSGISLKWVDGATFLDVFNNNSKVALINVGTKVITYSDGSFETLK